jgi:hypothetical protein
MGTELLSEQQVGWAQRPLPNELGGWSKPYPREGSGHQGRRFYVSVSSDPLQGRVLRRNQPQNWVRGTPPRGAMPHEAFRLTLGCIGDFGDRGQMARDPVAKEGGLSPYEWRTKERGGALEKRSRRLRYSSGCRTARGCRLRDSLEASTQSRKGTV